MEALNELVVKGTMSIIIVVLMLLLLAEVIALIGTIVEPWDQITRGFRKGFRDGWTSGEQSFDKNEGNPRPPSPRSRHHLGPGRNQAPSRQGRTRSASVKGDRHG